MGVQKGLRTMNIIINMKTNVSVIRNEIEKCKYMKYRHRTNILYNILYSDCKQLHVFLNS